MAIAMTLGGFTPAEADELRRTMGHQRKLPRLRAALMKLRERMTARGVAAETADQIAEDLLSFANYGFPESHAWSFALIAYATAYLKAHYPAEFFMALLNAWPMGFYPPSTLVHTARRDGVEVRPPCLKHGEWECTLEPGGAASEPRTTSPATSTGGGEPPVGGGLDDARAIPALRMGWRFIHGLSERARDALQGARREAPFTSVADIVRRAGLTRAEALQLARAGALEAFEPGRRRAAWEALRSAGDRLPLAPAGTGLDFEPEELTDEDLVFLDYLATGVCSTGHPMEHLRARLDAVGVTGSRGLESLRDGENCLVAGLVVARQHPATAKGTVFVLLEDEWGFINLIVPPRLYIEHQETINHSPFLLAEGRFERDGRVLNVVGRRFRKLDVRPLAHRSRDFR